MNYRLWLNDLDCGMAADQYATDWRDAMRKRYPEDHVRIEPALHTEPTLPIKEETDKFDPTAVATVRCPRCDAIIAFPGFDAMPCLPIGVRTAMLSSTSCHR